MMRALLRPTLLILVLLSACQCDRARVVAVPDAGCEAQELCGNALDDTCDGQVDEGCPCLAIGGDCECIDGADPVPCGEATGACEPGARTCVIGQWSACVGGSGPTDEQCDGVDNDCDGEVDEGLSRGCGSSVGTCRPGLQTCAAGEWGTCVGELAPGVELCEARLDENCDGTVDEGCDCFIGQSRPCGSSVGTCVPGVQACSATGQWQSCLGAVTAGVERCDGLDNDCDGEVDEELSRVCGSAVGACRQGLQTCAAGAWGTCAGEVAPVPERCEALLDENCDGTVDEGCECTIGDSRACGSSVGTCTPGTQTCDASGQWPSCAGGVTAISERCDGLDNDCDGAVDEEGICQPPAVSCPAAATLTVGSAGTLVATATATSRPLTSVGWTIVTRPAGATASPTPADAASTQLTPDRAGAWQLSFCATDDSGVAACCQADVTATVTCASPPPPPVSTACATSWDGRPIVEFAAVPAGFTYELSQGSALLGSAIEGQNHIRPAARIAAGAAPPGTSLTLEVRACRVGDPTCCSSPSTTTVGVVAECTTAVAPTSANVVLSEYVVAGEGSCAGSDCTLCQAGEAIEITNLTNCPVTLDGFHFAYRNSADSSGSYRWMNFGAADVIPPRGVYVAMRSRQLAPTCAASLGAEGPGLFGLKISALTMEGLNLCSGWFSNSGGGGQSELQVAPGVVTTAPTFSSAAAITRIAPYVSMSSDPACPSIGFNAVDSCGSVVGGSQPTSFLSPNQLGRLWHPCDAVTSPSPACVRD